MESQDEHYERPAPKWQKGPIYTCSDRCHGSLFPVSDPWHSCRPEPWQKRAARAAAA